MTVGTGSIAGPPAGEISVEAFLREGAYPSDAQLIDGTVVMTDATFRHQLVALRVVTALHLWTQGSPDRGRAGFGGNWVLDVASVVKPDAWWVPADRVGLLQGARTDGAPALAVEVRLPGTWAVDVGRKRSLYERATCAELWLVDPTSATVVALRRSATSGALDDAVEFTGDGTVRSLLLAGFGLPVSELFAD